MTRILLRKICFSLLFIPFFAGTLFAEEATSKAPHKADALVITCVDFRLNDDVARVLDERGLREKYDLVTLAGGSLAATNDFFPSWKDTFWSHLAFLVNLHGIHTVILIDHRDCGMYKFVYGRDLSLDPTDEKNVHLVNMKELKKQITEKYKQLKVVLWLMDTHGSIEELKD